jgi:hypothetical protein
MAGDWIKMRGNLWDDPRIAKLCDLTNSKEAEIIGALYWLWASADQHTETGVMPGLSLRQVDRKTGVKGFGEALCTIGWLADHPDGVQIVNFEEHNGASAKKRCQTAKRVANHKTGNAEVTQEALPENKNNAESGNADSVSGALPREREELEKEKDQEISDAVASGSNGREKKSPIEIKTYLENCKADGVKPIPEDDTIFGYAEEINLPHEFLRLCWREFVERNTEAKIRKSDWRAHFRNCVRSNWYKLWWLTNDNAYELTTTGKQAQLKHGRAAA